jgi:hypothetical protein
VQEGRAPIPRPRRYREVESYCDRRFTGGPGVAGNRREADHEIAHDDRARAGRPLRWCRFVYRKNENSLTCQRSTVMVDGQGKVGKMKWFGCETYHPICIRSPGASTAKRCPSPQPNQGYHRSQYRCRKRLRRPPQAGVHVHRVGRRYPHPAPRGGRSWGHGQRPTPKEERGTPRVGASSQTGRAGRAIRERPHFHSHSRSRWSPVLGRSEPPARGEQMPCVRFRGARGTRR